VNSERVDAYFIASLVSDGVIDESRLEDADGNPRPPEQVLESVDVTRPGLYEGFDYESDNAERNGDDLFWIDKDDRTDKNERYYNRDAGQYANIYADWNFYGYEHYIDKYRASDDNEYEKFAKGQDVEGIPRQVRDSDLNKNEEDSGD